MGCCEGWCNNTTENEKENEIVSGNDKKVSQYKNNNQKTFKNEKENEIVSGNDKKVSQYKNNNQNIIENNYSTLNKGELIDDNPQNNANITFSSKNDAILNNSDIIRNDIKKGDFIEVKGKVKITEDLILQAESSKVKLNNNCSYSFYKDAVFDFDNEKSVFFNYTKDGRCCYISNFKMGTIEGQELESVKMYKAFDDEDEFKGKKFYSIFGVKESKDHVCAVKLIIFEEEANKDLIERLEQNKEKKDNTTNYGDIVYNMMNSNNNEITNKNEQANLHKWM